MSIERVTLTVCRLIGAVLLLAFVVALVWLAVHDIGMLR